MPACPWPHKDRYRSWKDAQAHYNRLAKKFTLSDYFGPYECPSKEHWHLGNDYVKMRRHIKNSLRVGTAASKRQSRVRKRR